MSGPMITTVEVFPLSCDPTGLWLVNPEGAWPGDPVMDDSEPQDYAELELMQHGAWAATRLLHQTSCRTVVSPDTGRRSQVDTFLAAVECAGLVCEEWPGAAPVTPELFRAFGPPATHGPTEPPTVRDADVLQHGLRHYRFQLGPEGDATIAAVLDRLGWRAHLEPFTPVMAGLFRRVHEPA